MLRTTRPNRESAGVGASVVRPDGAAKTQGQFTFASDISAPDMLWGAIARSPHPCARILAIDTAPALAIPGVHAVVTHNDVPGRKFYGEERNDQPVFAIDAVRFHGEPIAAVAADHPETARRAAEAIAVTYALQEPLLDATTAMTAPAMHPDGNVIRHLTVRHGDPGQVGEVQVEGWYETGMQDPAFLGPEAGLAIPDGSGGVDLHVASQGLHGNQELIAAALGLPAERVRLHLAGVGGAFGGLSDLSVHLPLCLLALRTRRPVKMVFSRQDSLLGHGHRHPAKMHYRHHADRDGRLIKVEATIILNGGAYATTSSEVLSTACVCAPGPYSVPNATIEGWAVRTNYPPSGAMRGFGSVQVCFAYEAQMDKLARALNMDPVELRLRNALTTGDTLISGQKLTGPTPVHELISAVTQADVPKYAHNRAPTGLLRGVGIATGFKPIGYPEGLPDLAHAVVRVEDGAATVSCAAAEVGQGFVTIAQQVVQEILGLDNVALETPTTRMKSAGITAASRQTWTSGGAIAKAASSVGRQILTDVSTQFGIPLEQLRFQDGRIISDDGALDASVIDLLSPGRIYEAEECYRVEQTYPLDNETGQGNAHRTFAFVVHRAIVDVDPELGLVNVIDITT